MHRVRVKSLNNKRMNGEMMAFLIESYVSSLNKGVAPNIETAWTYICKNECVAAFEESTDIYEKELGPVY